MDDRPSSPAGSDAMGEESPSSSPSPEDEPEVPVKKVRKKRKPQTEEEKLAKKAKKRTKTKEAAGTMPVEDGRKKVRKQQVRRANTVPTTDEPLSAAQSAANEQMRRALEDDAYSALGSIVDTDTDEEDDNRGRAGGASRLDRNALVAAMRKRLWVERMSGNTGATVRTEEDDSKRNRKKRKKAAVSLVPAPTTGRRKEVEAEGKRASETSTDGVCDLNDEVMARDEGSIFGQTTGASNATWVECDKCKKWRRLRGVVDEKKLPSKWYCSMNKNDPERARCTAPEEEYETQNTPESAADALTRKHLRVWVRRLGSNENYEARLPTMTRGKKRNAAPSAKEPSEWVRCCNPSCGKWRALLRCMDAKQHVIDRTTRGEWFCVMNTWDEKMASCAAPQENLPVIGCPAWVMQDEA